MATPGSWLTNPYQNDHTAELLAGVLKLCQRMNSERDLDELLDVTIEEAARLLDAERASIFLLDDKKTELTSRVAMGRSEVIRLDATQGLAGYVVATGETVSVQDAYSDPRFYRGVDEQSGYRTRNVLAVPMRGREGDIIGTFEILNKRGGDFTESDAEILRSIAANAALAIQNAQLIEELKRHRRMLEAENRNLWREVTGRLPGQSIIGNSERIQSNLRLIERISDSAVSVLITGESGTGKDLVARALHYTSPRARGPFVALNCAALPETLVETELFGVEKGVATGVERRIGKFEAAHGGTLFLDEIGDLSLTAQAKILRVLQERVVERLGGRTSIPVDVRVISATNKDLEAEIRKGTFREDLLYRLNVIHMKTPALRDIPEDIPLLASYFLAEFSREMRRDPPILHEEAVRLLQNYHWPGNVRQMQNELRRLLVCIRGRVILPIDLSDSIQQYVPAAKTASPPVVPRAGMIAPPPAPSSPSEAPQPASAPVSGKLNDEIAALEKQRILTALAANNNNQQRTARVLGLSRQGLINKLKRYGIKTNSSGEEA